METIVNLLSACFLQVFQVLRIYCSKNAQQLSSYQQNITQQWVIGVVPVIIAGDNTTYNLKRTFLLDKLFLHNKLIKQSINLCQTSYDTCTWRVKKELASFSTIFDMDEDMGE